MSREMSGRLHQPSACDLSVGVPDQRPCRPEGELFQFLLATKDDLKEIKDLRKEVVSWLSTQGTDQWQRPWPSADAQHERLLTSIGNGETWIVRNGSELAATIAVDRYSDDRLWTEAERCDRALYLHRLMVRRSYAGCGLGQKINDWVAAWAAHNGDNLLRVDIWTSNMRLQQYYRDIGYDYLRTERVLSESTHREYPSGALFQRRI